MDFNRNNKKIIFLSKAVSPLEYGDLENIILSLSNTMGII